ncbi:MAG TPA: hypothetical protein PLG25_12270 [bacterium]|nr:hypothetical protein [bacterium]HMY37100.1 hypothetical protein [bacterium]HMZ04134.1 hypothetical protein [bacterium]HND78523.1 hypothetical protein [bacterium]HNE84647.1 hypothetical protein [bacterium]
MERFFIQVRPQDAIQKPQQRGMTVPEENWEIEWSTVADVPMMIDYFTITVGRYLPEESQNGRKRIEECWRASMIPGSVRKIRYGQHHETAITTPAKPLTDGIYVIKISAIAHLSDELMAEGGIGLAIFKLHVIPDANKNQPGSAEASPNNASKPSAENPIVITSETLRRLFDILDEAANVKPLDK